MVSISSLPLSWLEIGYGQLGRDGDLGFEGKRVAVCGHPYSHALSAHAPSHLTFTLAGRFRSFRCSVALNDSAPAGRTFAHFIVRADGVQVALAPYVIAGSAPIELHVDISGAETLELIADTTRWEYCHAVWLDPRVGDEAAPSPPRSVTDPLQRADIELISPPRQAKRCIATVVSPGFEPYLDAMLASLRKNGGCGDVLIAVFVVNGNGECERIAESYGAQIIRCRPIHRIGITIKSILYAVSRVIDAEQYLCLDADMLVLGALSPVFDALDVCPRDSLLVCHEANYRGPNSLGAAMHQVYKGHSQDLQRILGRAGPEAEYPLIANDGLFSGSRVALLALDGAMRAMPGALQWMEEIPRICWWRNQAIFNAALAVLECGVPLDDVYNVQLHLVRLRPQDANSFGWKGRYVKVLHFAGRSKDLHQEWQAAARKAGLA